MTDKKFDIKDILLEWAMLSEDGLSDNIYSDKNLIFLGEILTRRGLSREDSTEFVLKLVEQGEVKHRQSVPKEPEAMSPYPDKKYKPEIIGVKLKEILDANRSDPAFNSFEGRKDEANSIGEAVKIWKDTDPKVLLAINKISTGRDRSALGKGEIPLVWFLNGATHGGSARGDIVCSEGIFDVKGMPLKLIDIERNTFGSFDSTPSIVELNKFIEALRDPKVNEYVNRVILDDPDSVESFQGKHEAGERGVISTTKNWLKAPSDSNCGVKILKGLAYISKKVNELNEKEVTGTTVIQVFQKGEKYQATIKNPEEFIPKIKSAQTNPEMEIAEMLPINVKDDSISLSKLKKVKFISNRRNFSEIKDVIWKELSEKLREVYTGGIIIIRGETKDDIVGGRRADIIKSAEFNSKLELYAVGKGISLNYRGDRPEVGPPTPA